MVVDVIFFTVYSLYYAKPRNKLEMPHLRVIAPAGNTASFAKMSQRSRTAGNQSYREFF